jgi:hypothetical protein
MSLSRLLVTQAPAATVLIRLMVGGVFLSEGIQKFPGRGPHVHLRPAQPLLQRVRLIGLQRVLGSAWAVATHRSAHHRVL